MPPQSRGTRRLTSHSFSTPNLSSLAPLETSVSADQASNPHAARLANETDNTHDDDSSDDTQSPSSFERDLLFPDSSSEGSSSPNEQLKKRTPGGSGTIRNSHSLYAHPSKSYSSYLGASPASFAPPFYNRPPTPLPPSPSLTSLLRPPFTTSSRPTTPPTENPPGINASSSDTEHTTATTAATINTNNGTSSTAAVVARSARTAPTSLPRASPKVPTYEYYGFVLYVGSSLVFGMFLLWSFLPRPFLHQLGLYYYPDRWWSLAVPAWLVVLVCYIYVALACYNTGNLTKAVSSLECIVDKAGVVAVVDEDGKIMRKSGNVRRSSTVRAVSGTIKRAQSTKRQQDLRRRRSTKHGNAGGSLKKKRHRDSKLSPRIAGSERGQHDADVDVDGVEPQSRKLEQQDEPSTRKMPKELDWQSIWSRGTDAVMDVPIGGVCEVLYGRVDNNDTNDLPSQHMAGKGESSRDGPIDDYFGHVVLNHRHEIGCHAMEGARESKLGGQTLAADDLEPFPEPADYFEGISMPS
ncbi:MAG: hypothetical protein M1831_006815 [Alyxoria varia]|nr:MAG: hypothetical protein M1831_006815 [Alyxoria varia]